NVTNFQPLDIAALKTARDTTLKDPNWIPRKIYDNSRASLKLMGDISVHCWRRAVNQYDNQLLPVNERINNNDDWVRLYNISPDDAPWNYDFDQVDALNYKVNVGRDKNTLTLNGQLLDGAISNNVYYMKVLDAVGTTESVFRFFGNRRAVPNNYYNTEISNKFFALQVGTDKYHFRARLASGTSIQEAREKRAQLPFHNLIARHLWKSSSTNLGDFGSLPSDKIEWISVSASTETTYDGNNYEEISFNTNSSPAPIMTRTIVSSGNSRNETYGMVFVQGCNAETDAPGSLVNQYGGKRTMFYLQGWGDWDGYMVSLLRGTGADTNIALMSKSPTANYTSLTNDFHTRYRSSGKTQWTLKRKSVMTPS
ncbi:MAG: hypothetical protein ACRCTQ_06330, partial [Brevinemataceae bacterium]